MPILASTDTGAPFTHQTATRGLPGSAGADKPAGNQYLTGSEHDDILDGAGGDDEIYGYDGNDTLRGGDRDDFIDGADGDDVIDGGSGDDWLIGGRGNNVLRGGIGNDTLDNAAGEGDMYGDDGDDRLYASYGVRSGEPAGTHRLYGGNGNDTLLMDAGAGLLDGGAGDDVIVIDAFLTPSAGLIEVLGGAGNDVVTISLLGSARAVVADGGNGNDHLHVTRNFGGLSTVELTGGAGSDLFSIDTTGAPGSLAILDFQVGAGGDVLDVFDLVPLSLLPKSNASEFRFLQRGADTVVQVDYDLGGSTHDFVDVVTLRNVAASTLVAENMRYGYLPGAAIPAGQRIDGSDGADRLQGGLGNDHLAGGAGNDLLIGAGGSDVLDGGRGLDTVLYDGARFDYEISFAADGKWVDDKRGGLQGGRDALFNVERPVFADGALALDTGDTGVAAQTYRLYRAAFDRVPDESGLGFWLNRIDAGVSLLAVANAFVDSAEFHDLYGAATDNGALLRELYLNVFDREPDDGGFAFWLDILDSGRASVAEVLRDFSTSRENLDATVLLIAQGIPYQPYLE